MSTIVFDKPRQVRFTLAALRQFKAVAKMPLWKVWTKDEEGNLRLFESEMLTTVLWAGLIHEDSRLTFERAETLFQKYIDEKKDLADVVDAVMAAMKESGLFGEREGEAAEGVPAEAPNG